MMIFTTEHYHNSKTQEYLMTPSNPSKYLYIVFPPQGRALKIWPVKLNYRARFLSILQISIIPLTKCRSFHSDADAKMPKSLMILVKIQR